MHTNLDNLIKFITKNYPFSEETHSKVKGLSKDEWHLFAVRHLAMHHAKTAGKIVGVVEPTDHGEEINVAQIKEDLPKALVNTLRLAELVGMTEKDFIEALEKMYNDKV